MQDIHVPGMTHVDASGDVRCEVAAVNHVMPGAVRLDVRLSPDRHARVMAEQLRVNSGSVACCVSARFRLFVLVA